MSERWTPSSPSRPPLFFFSGVGFGPPVRPRKTRGAERRFCRLPWGPVSRPWFGGSWALEQPPRGSEWSLVGDPFLVLWVSFWVPVLPCVAELRRSSGRDSEGNRRGETDDGDVGGKERVRIVLGCGAGEARRSRLLLYCFVCVCGGVAVVTRKAGLKRVRGRGCRVMYWMWESVLALGKRDSRETGAGGRRKKNRNEYRGRCARSTGAAKIR